MRARRIAWALAVSAILGGVAAGVAPLDAAATMADCSVAALQAKAPSGSGSIDSAASFRCEAK